jgi:hypothetical protein
MRERISPLMMSATARLSWMALAIMALWLAAWWALA